MKHKIEWIPEPSIESHDNGCRWAMTVNGKWIARIIKEYNGTWTSGNAGDVPDMRHSSMKEASQRLVTYALEHL